MQGASLTNLFVKTRNIKRMIYWWWGMARLAWIWLRPFMRCTFWVETLSRVMKWARFYTYKTLRAHSYLY